MFTMGSFRQQSYERSMSALSTFEMFSRPVAYSENSRLVSYVCLIGVIDFVLCIAPCFGVILFHCFSNLEHRERSTIMIIIAYCSLMFNAGFNPLLESLLVTCRSARCFGNKTNNSTTSSKRQLDNYSDISEISTVVENPSPRYKKQSKTALNLKPLLL